MPESQPAAHPPEEARSLWGWAALAVLLACAVLATFAYAQHQRTQAQEMALTNQTLNTSLTQLQEQLQSVTERLNRRIELETAAAQPKPAAPATPRPAARKAAPRTEEAAAPRKDPRVDKLQDQLADQQKTLASTRDDLDKTREDLQNKLDANRDDLNGSISRSHDELTGSIARTHDELMTLQKRGERNYFEFSLNKSKQFQKVGPVSLELRKVDYKNKSYDLTMIVDDFQLQKKKINLYEPVWITLVDLHEPVQLIVNQIDKDKITGYISAPKYKKSDLQTTASAPAPWPTLQ